MGIGDRLKEERERLGLNQTDFAALAGASKNTQYNYEKGDRSPDAAYLAAAAAAGMDLLYVVTGERKPQLSESISEREASLLGFFRQLPDGEQANLLRTASALAATLDR
ncbi:helix-turn-helix domain-containing protein [Pseudomonas taiwanensis]|uniref:helix-turn-helix domain-containing protein n=1 Tax=Pseudomonas taiwanensis TaxID=470150 RepID=UPI001644783C|nr:helix-turn-helix domain-containing protein [Pseudomonas taiwanensis]